MKSLIFSSKVYFRTASKVDKGPPKYAIEQCTLPLHIAHCTLHNAPCRCTLHIAQCTLPLHIAHCTMHLAVARCTLHNDDRESRRAFPQTMSFFPCIATHSAEWYWLGSLNFFIYLNKFQHRINNEQNSEQPSYISPTKCLLSSNFCLIYRLP